MKVNLVALVAGFWMVSCSEDPPAAEEPGIKVESHEEAIVRFVDLPRRFKQAVESIHTPADFDRTYPELESLVTDFRTTGETFRKLHPPGAAEQERFRQAIQAAFSDNEPTGGAMLRLIVMPDREDKAAAWLERFTLAGQEAGNEVLRLYGASSLSGSDDEKRQVERVVQGMEEQIRTQMGKLLSDPESKPVPPLEPGPDGTAVNPLLKHLQDPEEEGGE